MGVEQTSTAILGTREKRVSGYARRTGISRERHRRVGQFRSSGSWAARSRQVVHGCFARCDRRVSVVFLDGLGHESLVGIQRGDISGQHVGGFEHESLNWPRDPTGLKRDEPGIWSLENRSPAKW